MTDCLHIYLTASRIHLRRQHGWPWRRRVAQLPSMAWDAREIGTLTLLAPSLGRWRGRVHVYLGAALCKLMALNIPPAVRARDEVQAVALALLQRELGLEHADWCCAVDRSVSGTRAIACAMRCSLLERLHGMVAEYGGTLASVRPLAGILWNEAAKDGGPDGARALLAVEEDAFSVMVATDGGIASALASPHGGWSGVAERELRRLAYGGGADAGPVRLATVAPEPQVAPPAAGAARAGADLAPPSYRADFCDMFLFSVVEAACV